jgi:hypothetical protein
MLHRDVVIGLNLANVGAHQFLNVCEESEHE